MREHNERWRIMIFYLIIFPVFLLQSLAQENPIEFKWSVNIGGYPAKILSKPGEVIVYSTSGKVFSIDSNSGEIRGENFFESIEETINWKIGTGQDTLYGKSEVSSFSERDINDDGINDTVKIDEYKIEVMDGASQKIIWDFWTSNVILTRPFYGDFDGDSSLDIAIHSKDQYLYILNGKSGKVIWRFKTKKDMQYMPTIEDINDDGAADLIVVLKDNCIYAIDGKSGKPQWIFKLGDNELKYAPKVIMLPEDYQKKIYVALDKETLFIDLKNGEVIQKTAIPFYLEHFVLVDILGNGQYELIPESDSYLLIVNPLDFQIIEKVEVLKNYKINNPLIADIDGDDKLEILCGINKKESFGEWIFGTIADNNFLFCFDTNSKGNIWRPEDKSQIKGIPELVVNTLVLDENDNEYFEIGETLSLSIGIKNIGKEKAFKVTVEIIPPNILSDLNTVKEVDNIDPNKQVTIRLETQIPSNTANGNYSIKIRIADRLNVTPVQEIEIKFEVKNIVPFNIDN